MLINFIERKNFISHSGTPLDFKIDCDALTDEEIETFAYIISKSHYFSKVVGIPRGGLRLEEALFPYRTNEINTTLIVDDVLTTGHSMEMERSTHTGNIRGAVMFSRSRFCPQWVTPVFQLK